MDLDKEPKSTLESVKRILSTNLGKALASPGSYKLSKTSESELPSDWSGPLGCAVIAFKIKKPVRNWNVCCQSGDFSAVLLISPRNFRRQGGEQTLVHLLPKAASSCYAPD